MQIMRILTFITFLTAILFSEVITHVVTGEVEISAEYEMPSDESNEGENSEESKKDNAEEDQIFENIEFSILATTLTVAELPCSYNTLLSQSLREIHSPPPDCV